MAFVFCDIRNYIFKNEYKHIKKSHYFKKIVNIT